MKNVEELQEEVKNLEARKEDARILYIKCEGGIETLNYLINELEGGDSKKPDKKVGKKTDSS